LHIARESVSRIGLIWPLTIRPAVGHDAPKLVCGNTPI
jgi:hypothetical protein